MNKIIKFTKTKILEIRTHLIYQKLSKTTVLEPVFYIKKKSGNFTLYRLMIYRFGTERERKRKILNIISTKDFYCFLDTLKGKLFKMRYTDIYARLIAFPINWRFDDN